MGRYDNAPIGQTCPTIDKIVRSLQSAIDDAEYILKHPEEDNTDEARGIISELVYYAIPEIESVRSDNGTLRDWGNELYSQVSELENNLDDAERKIEELESEVENLESAVDEYLERLEV